MIQVSDKNLITLQHLIHEGSIPSHGNFEVTEELLYRHREIYKSFGGGKTKNKQLQFARRYAGFGFLYLKKYRGIPAKDIDERMIYLIKNPAWPDHIKIGITTNLIKRLASYQTYDPHRAYSISSYEFILGKNKFERQLIEDYSQKEDKGEWVSNVKAEDLIRDIRSRINWFK